MKLLDLARQNHFSAFLIYQKWGFFRGNDLNLFQFDPASYTFLRLIRNDINEVEEKKRVILDYIDLVQNLFHDSVKKY